MKKELIYAEHSIALVIEAIEAGERMAAFPRRWLARYGAIPYVAHTGASPELRRAYVEMQKSYNAKLRA